MQMLATGADDGDGEDECGFRGRELRAELLVLEGSGGGGDGGCADWGEMWEFAWIVARELEAVACVGVCWVDWMGRMYVEGRGIKLCEGSGRGGGVDCVCIRML